MDQDIVENSANNEQANLYTHENDAERKIDSINNFTEHMKIHEDRYSGQTQSNTKDSVSRHLNYSGNYGYNIKFSRNSIKTTANISHDQNLIANNVSQSVNNKNSQFSIVTELNSHDPIDNEITNSNKSTAQSYHLTHNSNSNSYDLYTEDDNTSCFDNIMERIKSHNLMIDNRDLFIKKQDYLYENVGKEYLSNSSDQTNASNRITKLNLSTTPCKNDVTIEVEPKKNHGNLCSVKETSYFSIKKLLCVENNSSITSVLNHGQTSNCNVMYVCNICQISSIDPHLFALHMSSHKECSMHECSVCDQKFSTVVLWTEHMKYHRQKINLNLPNSHIQYPMIETNTNFTTDSANIGHQVHTSTSSSSTLRNKKSNMSIVTEFKEPPVSKITLATNLIVCDICENVFPSRQELIFHKSIHREPKPFSCKYCDKTFFNKWSCSQHENIHIHDKNKNTVEDILCYSCEIQNKVKIKNIIVDPTPSGPEKKKLSCNNSGKISTKGFTNHMQLRQRASINYFEEQVIKPSNSNHEVSIPNKKDQHFKDKNKECPQGKNYKNTGLVSSTLVTSTFQTGLLQQPTRYNCGNCKKEFYLSCQFKKHLTFNRECYSHFLSSTSHKSIQNGVNNTISRHPFECYICKAIFYNRTNCIRHLKNIHKIVRETDLDTYSIPKNIGQKKKLNTKTIQQNSKFPNRKKSRIISQRNRNKCKICSKSYSNISNLYRHQIIHHKINNKVVYCTICNKAFKHKYSLAKHVRTEHKQLSPNNKSIDDIQIAQDMKPISRLSDIALYLCKICKMEFADNNTLQNHIKEHTLNMYECKDCHQLFETNIALAKHIMNDHNSSITHNLNERTKESEIEMDSSKPIKRTLKCKICLKVLKSASYLTKHMRIHTNYKPFKCDLCYKTYRFKSNLKMHKRRIHFIGS